ncbi:MAG: hypothetical protein ACR2OO_08215 [Thermomicrobiales bacterium]
MVRAASGVASAALRGWIFDVQANGAMLRVHERQQLFCRVAVNHILGGSAIGPVFEAAHPLTDTDLRPVQHLNEFVVDPASPFKENVGETVDGVNSPVQFWPDPLDRGVDLSMLNRQVRPLEDCLVVHHPVAQEADVVEPFVDVGQGRFASVGKTWESRTKCL